MPAALVRLPGRGGEDRSLLDRSVMVDADGPAERLWAIDTALRSAAAGVIVADGSGLDMASTRRLQLSAESSGSCAGAVCLLARPLRERRALSAAATRWLVEPDPCAPDPSENDLSNNDGPGWAVELLRRKGLRPEGHAHRWRVRSCHATGDVRVVPIAADRSGPPARQVGRRTG
jgi:protein ImuA